VDGGGKAINFVSVDGLIIYDESAFKDLPASLPTEKRNFLLRTGQPLYVSRATGSVVVGPLGENQ